MSIVSDAQFVRFIHDYQAEHQYPPSVTDIVEHTGLSRSTVQWHLQRMMSEGKITRRPQSARTIVVLPAGLELIGKGKALNVETL